MKPALEYLPPWLAPHDATVRELLESFLLNAEVRTRNTDLIVEKYRRKPVAAS